MKRDRLNLAGCCRAMAVAATCASNGLPSSPASAQTWTADNGNGTFTNPLFYDEFSDPDLIRVGGDYYLTGTTMHTMPGLPVLHSRDLVNWELLSYASHGLDFGPGFRLEEGKSVYGQGIWAPCFRYHNWTPYRLSGAWPDADMLPLGTIRFDQSTRLTRDEQYTLMTLWSIARSPLMHGGDMTQTDDFTLSLLTNDEVLAVNQRSENNRQLFRTVNGLIAWVADVPDTSDRYLALFNVRDVDIDDPAPATATLSVPLSDLGLAGEVLVRDLWAHDDLGAIRAELTAEVPAHGARLFRMTPRQSP